MKKFVGAIFALGASVAFATTTVPVQLLNPVGSTSGQAVVSTGSGSAPAWGGIGVNGIAAIPANTVLANGTASSASPSAFVMPSCSTSTSALQWTNGTGFVCGTSFANLSGATFTGGLTLGYVNPFLLLNDTSGANNTTVGFQRNGTYQWTFNNQSNNGFFALSRFVSGSYVDNPISVSNSTGLVTFADGITANGTNTINGYLSTASAASTYAPLASPALTGTPTAPTAAATTGTGTQIATLGAIANNAAYPYFQAQMAANQTGVALSTYTKGVFGTVNFDPSGAWSSANNRWTPQKAGKYRVVCAIATQATVSGAAGQIGVASIYKNGTQLLANTQNTYLNAAGTAFEYPANVGLVALNGSTDYIECWGYTTGSSGGQFSAGGVTYFEAQYVGP
ncbi:hypothetical protein KDX13_06235 [Burkholderia cenocepacia]|uniref:hypothetical protein n=1 Tax=Burkholderia cenocepacia TaxID=95486 RepID=UPI001B9923DC|nr:hypothetical protein [Burkholderia cenocepacia]MBR8096307.1 hypothetical protein [Burkholderia cenocepacia]